MQTLLVFVVAISTMSGDAAFAPSDKAQLRDAVAKCLKLSSFGDKCETEHGPIGDWDVSSVHDMSELFSGATEFNADISKWDMSRVFNTKRMFYNARFFNSDISKWDVSSVTDMTQMFMQAYFFNSDISKWHVSRVRSFRGMFNMREIGTFSHKAPSFNADISQWDTSHATDMSNMFYEAIDFNQDLSEWDVARVRHMTAMFSGAKAFTTKLCGASWVFARATKDNMFKDSGGGAIAQEVCPDKTTTTTSTTTTTTTITTSTTTKRVTSSTSSSPPSTSTTSTSATNGPVADDVKVEGVNWTGTVVGVMVILVLAFAAFVAAIYVWFMVLKAQNPTLKSLQAVRRVPSLAANSIRELVSPHSTDALLPDEHEVEFEAENKSVTNSEDGSLTGDHQLDGGLEANGQDGDIGTADIGDPEGGIEMVELESKAEAPNDGDNQPDGIPLENLENGGTLNPPQWTSAQQQLQDIVDRSVIATPQEKADLVDSL